MNTETSWPPVPDGLPAPEAPPAPNSGGAGRTAALAVLAYIAFNLLLPLIPIHPRHLTVGSALLLLVLPTAAFMLLQLWLARALVGLRPTLLACFLGVALSLGVWFLLYPLSQTPARHTGYEQYGVAFLLGLAITSGGTFLGIALSRIVREVNVLLPVALVAMPIDYLGAMTNIGFTQNAVKQHPEMVKAVSIPVPTIGGLHTVGFIGPGDALFLAFFLAVVQRLSLNMRGTFWGMYVLLTLTMLIVLTTGANIAALVPMGLAVLIANGPSFRLQRSEVFATLYAAVLVLVLVVAFYGYSHTHFFHH